MTDNKCTDCYYKQLHRYKQALEKIEEIVIYYDDWDLTIAVQEIINEVKGE